MNTDILKHYEEKASKGRNLQNRITALEELKKNVVVYCGVNVVTALKKYDFNTTYSEGFKGQDQAFLESTKSRLIQVIVEEIDKEVVRLHNEFEAL